MADQPAAVADGLVADWFTRYPVTAMLSVAVKVVMGAVTIGRIKAPSARLEGNRTGLMRLRTRRVLPEILDPGGSGALRSRAAMTTGHTNNPAHGRWDRDTRHDGHYRQRPPDPPDHRDNGSRRLGGSILGTP